VTSLLHRIGAGAARHPWRYVAGWLVAAALVFVAAGAVGGVLTDTYEMPGTDSQAATDLLRDRFPEHAGADARVVVHDADGAVPTGVLDDVARRIGEQPHVAFVESPTISTDGGTAVLTVRYDAPVTHVEPAVAAEHLAEAAAPARDAGLQVEYGGEVLDNVYEQGTAELIGFGLAAVILLFAFGSAVAAGLPLAIAALGLGIGMSLVTMVAKLTTVSTIAPTIAAMVGIGVGIDYSLLVVSRHRQHLLDGMDVPTSIARANATAGRSVVFAGGTVLLAICGLALSGVPNFVMMGVATAIVVAIAMLAAVSLLPALLSFAGLRVLGRRTRRLVQTERAVPATRREPLAARWAARTSRRPVVFAMASAAVLLVLCAPVLDLRLGQSDAGSEPTSSTSRRAYDLVAGAFGPGANGPLVVVADLNRAGVDVAAVRAEVAATPGVVSVSEPVYDAARSVALLSAVPASGPQDDATDALVASLREDVLPEGVRVTGATAAFMDFNQRLQDRLPLVIGVVVLSSLVLLTFVFRSVVAPLKAAVMNLLSVGAAFGAVVVLFQWGWGTSVLGLEQAVPVNAFVPMFMFAILFGLSMDYEVFLLSRVREEFEHSGDPRGSVVAGLGATGRVISSAALIMIAVFTGFAMDDAVAIKMMGVGMAVAIAVDATLVRLVLVPSTMVLLGRWNWWLPGWLDRVLPAAHRSEPPVEATLPSGWDGDLDDEREPALV
jgi:putative drug exporter of the RND superfamily